MIKEYEQNYAVKDKQDLLAMCACNLHHKNGTWSKDTY